MTDDGFGAFGSGDDDSDDSEMEVGNGSGRDCSDPNQSEGSAASASALCLTKSFLRANSKILLGQRRVYIQNCTNDDTRENDWKAVLTNRGIGNLISVKDSNDNLCDALLSLYPCNTTRAILEAYKYLVPGGLLLVVSNDSDASSLDMDAQLSPTDWVPNSNGKDVNIERIYDSGDNKYVFVLQKRLAQIQERTCLWLSSKHSVIRERARVEEATVLLSADEISNSHLTEPSLVRAVERMKKYGYCILPRLLDPNECQSWGQAVLSDLHQASELLLKEGVDIFHPQSSENDPASYRELSMREDLRMDLRDGPQLRKMRGGREKVSNNKPIVLQRDNTSPSSEGDNVVASDKINPFFRQNASMLEVVRRTMNPQVGDLYKGNFGRWNFSGSGPDGSYQDMRLSSIGGIVSLPGAAEQALHADTPHLFEVQTLPAHYINAFTLGCAADDQVGCTAFIHGSHFIEFTTKYMAESDNSNSSNKAKAGDEVYEFLVRPQLELGDVLLFDCRTLHLGLANMSDRVERPILYCNMTHAWFVDVKNWDQNQPIFKDI